MSTHSTPLPKAMLEMTPEKYQALTPAKRQAYDKKANAALAAQQAQIAQQNAESNAAFAAGIAALVAQHPGLEWEIVHNYLQRTGRKLAEPRKI